MKQTLTLKLGQHLTMTPQLQQAIRLLQLSTLDLQLEIQQAIETNPMLELAEEDDDDHDLDALGDDHADGYERESSGLDLFHVRHALPPKSTINPLRLS